MRARLPGESGFSIVEVLVAAVLLLVGLLGTFTALGSASHLDGTVQRQQAATARGELVIGQMESTPYASTGLASLPTGTSDGNASTDLSGVPTNPTYWVRGTKLLIPTNFSAESSPTLGGVAAGGEPLLTGGTFVPGPEAYTADGYSGTVYRFVSAVSYTCPNCTSATTAKRLTVAVVLTAATNAGANKPVWLSTVVPDPAAGPAS